MGLVYLGDDLLWKGIVCRSTLVGHFNIGTRGGGNSHRGLNICKGPRHIGVVGSKEIIVSAKKKSILSCSVALPHETCNDATGRVLAIEGIAQLLASRVVLLLEGESLKDKCVPFVLKGNQQRGYGGVGRGSRSSRTGT